MTAAGRARQQDARSRCCVDARARWRAPPRRGRRAAARRGASASMPRLRPALDAGQSELRRRSARPAGRGPASSFASARATSTSWVLEARSSHQPSAVLTRAPSVRSTSAPRAASRSSTSSTTANLRLSSTWKRSSGVLTIAGMAPIAARSASRRAGSPRGSGGPRRRARRRSRNNRGRRRCGRSSRRRAARRFPSSST